MKVLTGVISGSGLSWQGSKKESGEMKAAGAKAGDTVGKLCPQADYKNGERRCVGQRVSGLGGIKNE